MFFSGRITITFNCFSQSKKIERDIETNYGSFYFSSKTNTKESDTDNLFESICTTIISNIQKLLGKGSG